MKTTLEQNKVIKKANLHTIRQVAFTLWESIFGLMPNWPDITQS